MRRRWGVGCVFFEVLSLYPLFPGTNELDQVKELHGGSRVAVWPLLSHIMFIIESGRRLAAAISYHVHY